MRTRRNHELAGEGREWQEFDRQARQWQLRQDAVELAQETARERDWDATLFYDDDDQDDALPFDDRDVQVFGPVLPDTDMALGWATLFNMLIEAGVALPVPQALDDATLTRTLAEVIHSLETLRLFLQNTNHLDDRALYTKLWCEVLREECQILNPPDRTALWLDMVDGDTDEEIETYLQHYASPSDRAAWARDFPDESLPPHAKPPYDRDRHLPGATSATDDPRV